MEPMIDFSVAMLGALSDWLMSEPIIYLFGLALSLFIVRLVKIFIP